MVNAEASSSRSRSRSLEAEAESSGPSRCSTPDPEVLESYHNLMASILPPLPAGAKPVNRPIVEEDIDNEITMESGEKRPVTKAEKQNAKKKRRKERERDMKAEAVSAEREEKFKEELAKPVGESTGQALFWMYACD
jgi:hypothetical protein